MPVEVKSHKYLYNRRHWADLPSPIPSDGSDDSDDAYHMEGWSSEDDKPDTHVDSALLIKTHIRKGVPDEKRAAKYKNWDLLDTRPFRYNPLHDLESLWWVGSYFLFTRAVDIKTDGLDEAVKQLHLAQLNKQRESMDKLFFDCSQRYWVMFRDKPFSEELCSLHRSMYKAGQKMDQARDVVVRAYHYMEEDIVNREFSVQDATYTEMRRLFSSVAKRIRTRNIETIPLVI